MSIRAELITALVAEMLGPRLGANEVLLAHDDPQSEYILGVLVPFTSNEVAADASEELSGEEESNSDDSNDAGSSVSPAAIQSLPSPVLDPRSRPASLGLSFVLQSASAKFGIDACFTWSRYRTTQNGDWQRVPHGEVWLDVDCTTSAQHRHASCDSFAKLVIRSSKITDDTYRVSVFLVNETPAPGGRSTSTEMLFQPQVRIRCHDDAKLMPIKSQRPSASEPEEPTEEANLEFLYRDKLPYARGHLCSAVWRSVDPEHTMRAENTPQQAPFQWVDGEVVFSQEDFAKFANCDVRTEYIPLVWALSPDPNWPEEFAPPELAPDKLAEITTRADVISALMPLVKSYKLWIAGIDSPAATEPGAKIAKQIIGKCLTIADRIEAGVRCIADDENARLAFNFANKAIALQSRWVKGRVNNWRPFQLAFILLNVAGCVDPTHPDREICDLLWFPTGGGKTEAYLGLAAFVMAWRRLTKQADTKYGTSILSRYTLRLLTIQQFRRALALVTACEKLRNAQHDGKRGWRPVDSAENWLWGEQRFSAGLWVGGGVTPNNLQDFTFKKQGSNKIVTIYGALSILKGKHGGGEPAQVLSCPIKTCSAVLALPSEGLQKGEQCELHLVVQDCPDSLPDLTSLSSDTVTVKSLVHTAHAANNFSTITVTLSVDSNVQSAHIDEYINRELCPRLGPRTTVAAARPTRPGYFLLNCNWKRSRPAFEFEIYCPNPNCELNKDMCWTEHLPAGSWEGHAAFRNADGTLNHMPIPAWTVDDQVYHRAPSMVIATVDKFARLAFEPKAATLFGNVERYSPLLGYYRTHCTPKGPDTTLPPVPLSEAAGPPSTIVDRFSKPDLILQDELHLIEGPLGSMVGLYEVAIDTLCSNLRGETNYGPKYIASTATVRQAQEQVKSLYNRDLSIFPPTGVSVDDSFFARTPRNADPNTTGKIFMGVFAPGRGGLTPVRNCWSRILQQGWDMRQSGAATDGDLDPFWTLVGYFNAIRELAGAQALCSQDIPMRMQSLGSAHGARVMDGITELSSRIDSLKLPGTLDALAIPLSASQNPPDVVLTTSMFGTGVDVERLGIMYVNGQPKTTSSYIQATGRVGRAGPGLVITMLNAARPRDLNQYEFFVAFHKALYRHVEPVTVNPFSPRARDRAIGPVSVAILRQASELFQGSTTITVDEHWRVQERTQQGWTCHASRMDQLRSSQTVSILPSLFEIRAKAQPALRRPDHGVTEGHVDGELNQWQVMAQAQRATGQQLLYFESTLVNAPSHGVVLGDLRHLIDGLDVVYEDAPNSLREVEATTTFKGSL